MTILFKSGASARTPKRSRALAGLSISARFWSACACAAFSFAIHAAETEYSLPKSEWKALFNGKDLSNWDKYLSVQNASGPLVPNRDPKNVFTVTNVDGQPAIHVSGEVYGAITTHEPPRANVGRDTGILYSCVGEPNPGTGWMTSVENNIMEKGVGQWWSVNGAIIDVEGEFITPRMELYVPYKKEGSGERNIVWKKGGPRITASPANGITAPFDAENVFGNWNTVEVAFLGGQLHSHLKWPRESGGLQSAL
jgi:hypothetical protein